VYRAFDTVLKRGVAIKFVHARGGAGASSGTLTRAIGGSEPDRVLSEARAMANFSHPGLCRVLDVAVDGAAPFIVMEWVDGVGLHEAWRGLGLEERLSMFTKIVGAVAAAHAAGLVHRDLKPANILVNESGEPVIVDFGLAGMGGEYASGRRAGTPGYAAPEQFVREESDPPVGPAVDVYALGVIMYEMITDQPPFVGKTPEELIQSASTTDPALPELVAPACPTALQRICLSALERTAAKRYPTARELGEDLRRYSRGETVLANPSQLASEFTQQVEAQVSAAARWERLGFITAGESRALARMLRRMQRPDSPWIVDSRRLSHSQVSLYLGGWLIVIALTIGLARAWAELSSGVRLLLPGAVTAFLLAAGSAMQWFGQRRVALVYLVTASIALPIAFGLLLRETQWLSAGGVGMGEAEIMHVFEGRPPQGLFNEQLLACAILWTGACVGLRLWTGSIAFTTLGTLAGIATWLAAWLVRGNLLHTGTVFEMLAGLGRFLLPLSIPVCLIGSVLSTAEDGLSVTLGHHRSRRSDAWPLLIASVSLTVLGLGLIAYGRPDWYGLPRLIEDDRASRALAFMMSGTLQLCLAWLLTRRPGDARETLGRALRWVLPSHFLAPLLILHIEDVWHMGRVWLIVMAGLSIVLCFVSVIKQWKPFVVNGLVYLAVAYFHGFDDVCVRASGAAKVVLATSILFIGVGLMIAAWWLPDRLADGRVRKMLQRAKSRFSSTRAKTHEGIKG
jgi:hypothetical protein